MARYSVMKREPPPATRLIAPKKPPPPACWVWVVIWTEADIQESSPASEMTASLGPRANSRTGMVVPRMRFCMDISCDGARSPYRTKSVQSLPRRDFKLGLTLVERPDIRSRLAKFWPGSGYQFVKRGGVESARSDVK